MRLLDITGDGIDIPDKITVGPGKHSIQATSSQLMV